LHAISRAPGGPASFFTEDLIQEESAMETIAGTLHIEWEAQLDRARERARKETKPILIDFSAAPQ
jgi:hypothetical protein